MIHPFRFTLKPKAPFPEPRVSPVALWLIRTFSGVYRRRAEGVRSVAVPEPDRQRLTRAIADHDSGKHNLILAFRHIHKADAAVLANLFDTWVRRWGRTLGIRWNRPPHVRFLYGRNVLNWAGAGARYLFPRMGGIPVLNRLTDARSITLLKEAARSGEYPLALAPEGQITYHADRVYDLGHGTAALARWAAEGSAPERPVTILPISIRYHFGSTKVISTVLSKLKEDLAYPGSPDDHSEKNLRAAAHHVFDALTQSYRSSYPSLEPQSTTEPDTNLTSRAQDICEWSLRIAECLLGTSSSGEFLDRLFRIRVAGYARFFPDGENLRGQSPGARRLAEIAAEEASLALIKSEVVDLVQYFRDDDISEKSTPNQKAEFILNVYDVVNRMYGGDIQSRFDPRDKSAFVRVGEPISSTKVFTSQGPGIKLGMRALTAELKARLEGLSKE